ncbi:hypothetical protein J7J95_01515 [bacterium]|nr:hypothetical protein [bacterium]
MKKLFVVLVSLVSLAVIVVSIKGIYDWKKKAWGKPANIIVDASLPQKEINPQLWQNFAQGGEEPKDMLAPILAKIRPLHPQVIRIDHIFDFYNVYQGPGQYNFSQLDKVVFTILKTGARPMFSLSYIPVSLARNGQTTSPPQNWQEWENLITATVKHYSGKDGLNINNVYYEVFNEPDLFGNWHYAKDPNYLTLYYHTAKGAMKATNTNPFKIGGPATTGFYPNWIKALLRFCHQNRLPLDFLSWHRYSPHLPDYDADFEKLNSILTSFPEYQNVERLITEFGPGPQRSSWYASKVSAAHTIAVTAHLLGKVHRVFAFELKDGPSLNTHQWGIITHENNGQKPKPRWYAYLFLNKLRGKRLPLEGNGSWVSGLALKEGKTIKILLVNFDPSQKHQEYVPVRIKNMAQGRWQLSFDYLFQKDYQLIRENHSTTLFFQTYLPPNEAVIISLKPLF